MKILKTIDISASADDVWHIVGKEFDQAYRWMGAVKHSYRIDDTDTNEGAPMSGRVCTFDDKPNGFAAREIITDYSDELKKLTFKLHPVNAPSLLPIRSNTVQIIVSSLSARKSRVTWISEPNLKTPGKLLSPLLKIGLGKAFAGILKDLKAYAESAITARAA